jgi:hypothetical protein
MASCWCEVTGELKKAATLTKVNSELKFVSAGHLGGRRPPGQQVAAAACGSPWNPVDQEDDTNLPLRPPLVASPSRHLLISSALGVTLLVARTSPIIG